MSRVSDLHRMEKEDAKLAQKLGRDPSIDELAKSAGLSLNRAKDAMELTEPDLCLDAPSFEERDGDTWINNFPDPEQEDIGEALEQEEKMLSLCQCMECLDERESRIIILYFGLDSEEPMTLEQIGTLFGVTRERVRQLRNSALEKLRARHGEILEELASA